MQQQALIDIETARRNLKTIVVDDDNLMVLIRQASALVLDYMKVSLSIYSVDPTQVPLVVQAAVLCCVRQLLDNPDQDPLSEAVRSILHRMRDPALA